LATAIFGHVRVWTRLLVAAIAIGALPAVVHATTLATPFVAENSPLGLGRNPAPAHAQAESLQAPELPLESVFGYGQIVVDNAYATRGLLPAIAQTTRAGFLRSATQAFKGGTLTNVGRALTKHPEVAGLTKDTLRTALRTDAAINSAAERLLGEIIETGSVSYRNLPRFGATVEIRGAAGLGARFSEATDEFIGFIGP
jgi:hypothetical protein